MDITSPILQDTVVTQHVISGGDDKNFCRKISMKINDRTNANCVHEFLRFKTA
jgi:hypothetical protein